MMKTRVTWALVFCGCLLNFALPVREALAAREALPEDGLHLSQAAICEALEAFKPFNISAVFSVRTGSVMCFTSFDLVPRETSIYHDWIRRDNLIFRKKLVLKPPSWSSVSSIQLREADIGPWRVEIRDADGVLLRVLRFSITE
jgi:hypothetical protein